MQVGWSEKFSRGHFQRVIDSSVLLVSRSEATGGPPNVRPPIATGLEFAAQLGHVTLHFRRECRWYDEGWGRDKRQSHVRYFAKLTAHDTGHTKRATSFVNAHKEGHIALRVYTFAYALANESGFREFDRIMDK